MRNATKPEPLGILKRGGIWLEFTTIQLSIFFAQSNTGGSTVSQDVFTKNALYQTRNGTRVLCRGRDARYSANWIMEVLDYPSPYPFRQYLVFEDGRDCWRNTDLDIVGVFTYIGVMHWPIVAIVTPATAEALVPSSSSSVSSSST